MDELLKEFRKRFETITGLDAMGNLLQYSQYLESILVACYLGALDATKGEKK